GPARVVPDGRERPSVPHRAIRPPGLLQQAVHDGSDLLRVDLSGVRVAAELAALHLEIVQLSQELLAAAPVLAHVPLRPLVGLGGTDVQLTRELAEFLEARARQ